MGRKAERSIDDQQGNVVVISEVGAPALPPRQSAPTAARPLTARRNWFIYGSAIVLVFVGIQMSLPADTPLTRASERAIVDPVSACVALTNAAPGATMKIPRAYTRVAIMREGETIDLGLTRPDGLLELCRDQGELAAQGVTTRPSQDELTQLPEGMSYVYKPPLGASKDGIVLKVAGVLLEDGTVTESLTLPDGRVAPNARATTN